MVPRSVLSVLVACAMNLECKDCKIQEEVLHLHQIEKLDHAYRNTILYFHFFLEYAKALRITVLSRRV
jgi:hypothetical protein